MSQLNQWNSFYVIVGSSAGALIGLQFVVLALIADLPIARGAGQAGAAFSTPNVIHFGIVLLLAAVASATWHGIATVAALWGLMGLSGLVYAALVARRLRVQTVYQPVFEDWVFHVLLPFAGYAMLAGAACAAYSHTRAALFVVGAAVLLLLFIGIHNAWDIVTYQVFVKKPSSGEAERHR